MPNIFKNKKWVLTLFILVAIVFCIYGIGSWMLSPERCIKSGSLDVMLALQF